MSAGLRGGRVPETRLRELAAEPSTVNQEEISHA
jgi:hypothetical protein